MMHFHQLNMQNSNSHKLMIKPGAAPAYDIKEAFLDPRNHFIILGA